MARWQPDSRERLERAALDLFVEQGFGETTVPQITARAGLTTRTFFRHFTDKREVLFANEGDIPELAARMIAEAPAALSPMEVIQTGLETVAAELFAGDAEHYRKRRTVIESDDGLRERELHKLATLTDAIRTGFDERGVDALTSTLIAHATVTVFSVSIDQWLHRDDDVALSAILPRTLEAFRSVLADPRRNENIGS
jgi:AcrR family transcriptional regulator